MENKKMTVQELSKKVVEAVRAEAAKIPDFDYGAIRLSFYIYANKEAEKFLGGFGIDGEIDLVYPIKERGNMTRPAKWRGKEDRKECSCRGYSALKVDGCMHAYRSLGRRSSSMPKEDETWGRVNDKGCVLYNVLIEEKLKFSYGSMPVRYFDLYVSVSGATGEEDELCALAPGDVLQDWCDTELDDFMTPGHFEKYLSLIKPE